MAAEKRGTCGFGSFLWSALLLKRHRDDRELFEIGRHHVGGQLGAQRLRDLVAGQVGVLLEGVVGHEFDDTRLGLECRDGGLRDLRQIEQHCFDLVQFDAIAANLDLGVDAAAIFDLAVLVDAAEVAGAIDAPRRVVLDLQEIADELLHRQFVAIHVAEREADAGNADLAKFAARDGLVFDRIEDDDRIGRERNADGDRLVRLQLGQGRRNGRFSRAIGIQDPAARAIPARDKILRARFAADQQDAQMRQVLLDRRKQGRAAGKARNAAFAQEVGEFVADQARARPRGDKRRACHQRHPDLLDRKVEGDRHALIDAVARRIAVQIGGDAHEIADARVRDGNALRIAGRARGVDDVADRIGCRRHVGGPRVRLGIDLALGLIEKYLLRFERGKTLVETGHRDDGLDLGVVNDEANAFCRKCAVERHVGSIDLHHRQHRDIGFGRLVEQKADAVARLGCLDRSGIAPPDWRGNRAPGR